MNVSKCLVSRVCESLDQFTETLAQSDVVVSSSVTNLQAQIDQLRVDIFADCPLDESPLTASHDPRVLDSSVETELCKARERISELESALSAQCGSKEARVDDEVAQLESRIRELVDRESVLNSELEHARLADHRRTLQQNQQVLMLRAEVDAMRRNEASLRDKLSETTERCEQQLTQAKSDNSADVNHLTSLLHDNQSQLLSLITDLDAARRQLEITDRKLDERSAQLDDALQQLKTAEDSVNEMQQSNSELRQQVSRVESERDLMLVRLAAYENSAVDSVVGADELVRQTCELEKQVSKRDGTITYLESVVTDLKSAVRNAECREEMLATENVRLRQELDSVSTEQLQTRAGLQAKVQLFEQVMAQKDREISTLRGELASPARLSHVNNLSGSCFAKIVAASTEPDADRRLSRLQDIFREMNAAHAKQASSFNEQLDHAGEALQLFKEHAKKQFEAQQEKVRLIRH